MRFRPVLHLFIIAFLLICGAVYSRDSYEDYMEEKGKPNVQVRRDKPLSEINPDEREELLEELRGAVREEIDQTIKDEDRKGGKKVNENKFVEEVRSIVREEIEDAIKIKQGRYPRKNVIEVGGFISYQARGVESDKNDNNSILKVFPQFAYFFNNTIALAVKGEAEFNLTNNTRTYAASTGPQFVFPITKKEDIFLCVEIMGGVSGNSEVNNKIGYRYSNGLGLKFVMTSGVIFNVGVQLVFDNLGENVQGFQNIIVPTIGITAWF